MKFLVILACLSATSVFAGICKEDDRTPSFDRKVARLRINLESPASCTATLISNNCFISAGHCPANHKAWITEFEVPNSDPNTGNMFTPSDENIFRLKKIYGKDSYGKGRDWLVFSVKRNSISKEYPGDSRGWYEISERMPDFGTVLKMTGYGKSKIKYLKYTQQSSTGEYLRAYYDDLYFEHMIDSQSGTSGSSIIDTTTDKIIGIHTHGGCRRVHSTRWNGNLGTMIEGNHELIKAIRACQSASGE